MKKWLVILFLFFPYVAQAACTGQCVQEQVKNNNDASCTGGAISFPSINIGSEIAPLLVVDAFGARWGTGTAPAVTSIADNCSGSWLTAFTNNGGVWSSKQFYSEGHPNSVTCTITVTFAVGSSSTNQCAEMLHFTEVSGIQASSALDQVSNTGSSTSTTAYTTGNTPSTTQANEYAEGFAPVGGISPGVSTGPDNGYTALTDVNNGIGNPNLLALHTAYKSLSGVGIQVIDWTFGAIASGISVGGMSTFFDSTITPTPTVTATATLTATQTATATATATATMTGGATPTATITATATPSPTATPTPNHGVGKCFVNNIGGSAGQIWVVGQTYDSSFGTTTISPPDASWHKIIEWNIASADNSLWWHLVTGMEASTLQWTLGQNFAMSCGNYPPITTSDTVNPIDVVGVPQLNCPVNSNKCIASSITTTHANDFIGYAGGNYPIGIILTACLSVAPSDCPAQYLNNFSFGWEAGASFTDMGSGGSYSCAPFQGATGDITALVSAAGSASVVLFSVKGGVACAAMPTSTPSATPTVATPTATPTITETPTPTPTRHCPCTPTATPQWKFPTPTATPT